MCLVLALHFNTNVLEPQKNFKRLDQPINRNKHLDYEINENIFWN